MPSKKQDVAKPNISPVLFMAVDGEPMSFFLRPGAVKRRLQPLITAGGGMVCNIQQPGAILLIDQQERGFITETTAHWYVSTQYIHDCVEKDEQLNLEDYRLNPEVPRHSARLNSGKETSPGLLGGRVAYTPEDDAAILSYVSKHKEETGGNRLWQEMEKQSVTSHSWQSMKYRYRVRLAKKQSEVVKVATTAEDTEAAEGETKAEGNQEMEAEKSSSAEDATSPQSHSAESDPTQIDAQSIPAERTQPEIIEAQTPISPQGEVPHENPQTDQQPAESSQVETVEAETSNSAQPEGPCSDPQADSPPVPAESSESETEEPQAIISSPKERVPEDSPPAQPKVASDSPSQKKTEKKQKPEQPRRQLTRRQLQLEELMSPGPHSKNLRSPSTSAEPPSSSPQSKETKSAVKSAPQKDTMADQPPSKRARGQAVAAEAEGQQEETGQATVSETAPAEFNPMPHEGEKKNQKQKRKLGILELAAKEFEEDSESGEDEAPFPQNPTETVTMQPTSRESPLPPSSTAEDAASTQSSPKHGPGVREKAQETQASSDTCPPETSRRQPAATEAVGAACSAHLFIFDSESQVEDSQSIIGANTAAAAAASRQPTANKEAAFSLTQIQLEEDKQRLTELMNQTNHDLVGVTKALLKTSGDFSAALDLLLNPLSISGPFWDRCDDGLLLSADPVVRRQLQEKYGEENVAKRIVFLEAEG